MSYHQTTVLGNLGIDPEEKTFDSGASVVNFTLAVNESFTNSQDQKVERTTWYPCRAWGNTGKAILQYKRKGDQLLVVGNMRFDREKDSNGQPIEGGKTYHQLVVQRAVFVGRANGNGASTEERVGGDQNEPELEQSDDIPF